MADIVFSMPQEMTPYLPQKTRKEMVELKLYGVSGDEQNMLHGTSVVDSVTNDYVHIVLSDALSFEIKRIPCDQGDILCLVKTYHSPFPSSEIAFYNMEWGKLDQKDFLPEDCFTTGLLQCPDSMGTERYEELLALIDFDFFQIRLIPDELAMTIELVVPTVNKDEKKELETMILQRKLNFNGQIFN